MKRKIINLFGKNSYFLFIIIVLKIKNFGPLTDAKNFVFPEFPISINNYISSLKEDELYSLNIKSNLIL